MIIALINDFKSSIKSPESEEKLDLLLYRPFGYLIAKMANVLGMTPSMLSILGLLFGLISSFYFLDYYNPTALMWASFYFILSGILDSSDGQLARISNQSTKLGLILDGICDSFVIIAIYASCAWPFLKNYGPIFLPVILLALYLHSCQCAILDFYHREYLFFGYGKTENDTYWNQGVADGHLVIKNSSTGLERLMNSLRLGWVKKQQFLTTRTDDQRRAMREYLLNGNEIEKNNFKQAYRRNNLWLLPFLRLIGVNSHTVLIIVYMFLHRFDIFLVAFDLIVFNLIILVVGTMQRNSDLKFFSELNLKVNE